MHVLDLAPLDGSDPVENHATVEAELQAHGAGLERLPRILCLSKADLRAPRRAPTQAAVEWRERLLDRVLDVVVTSAATGRGLDDLRGARSCPASRRAGGGGRSRRSRARPSTSLCRPGAGAVLTVGARALTAPFGCGGRTGGAA